MNTQRLFVGWVFGALCLGSCHGHDAARPSRDGITWGPAPPARPGSSITHTKMCDCLSCEDAACCRGADESQASCDLDSVEQRAEGDDAIVDFSTNDECGIELRSCEASCQLAVWRIESTQSCEGTRPAVCCGI